MSMSSIGSALPSRALGRPRRRPLDRVSEHLPHVVVVVDRVRLVAGAEVEHPAVAATVTAAGPEHLAAGEPGVEHERVRRGDIEPLAVHLRLLQFDVLADPVGDRVWLGSTAHSRSVSAASRHLSEQLVPISRLKIFE